MFDLMNRLTTLVLPVTQWCVTGNTGFHLTPTGPGNVLGKAQHSRGSMNAVCMAHYRSLWG